MGRTIVDIDAQMEKRGFLCKCLTSLTFSVARFGNQAASDQGKAGNFTGQGWGLVTLLTLVGWESEAIDASEKGYGWYEPQHPPNCIMYLLYNRNLQFSLTNCFGLIIPVSHSPFIATPKKRDNIYIYISLSLYPRCSFLQNRMPQGRYRMVFRYHSVQNFDLGLRHIVSVPYPGPLFCIRFWDLLLSIPDHSVRGLKSANQWSLQIGWIQN